MQPPGPGIEALIARFEAVLRAAGIAAPERTADHAPLELVAERIAPWRLPDDVEAVWRAWRPPLPVEWFPRLETPDEAARLWQMVRDINPGGVPDVLFPFCEQDRSVLSVELATEANPGGRLFAWHLEQCSFRLRFLSATDWLETLCALIEERAYEPPEDKGLYSRMLLLDHDRWETLADASLGGDVGTRYDSPAGWPDHWNLHPDDADLVLRGATHSIAQLVQDSIRGPMDATIVGTAKVLGGTVSEGHRLLITDGTAAIDIWCPKEVHRFNALLENTRFELDVTAQRPVTPVAPSPDEVSTRFVEALLATPAQAVVRSIRPIPGSRWR